MNSAAVVTIAFSFLVALLCSWVLLLPFFSERVVDEAISPDETARNALNVRKELALTEIEELEMDRLGGKINEADYQQSRAELTADAADILNKLENTPNRGRKA